jgi:hypothetical protein
MFDPRTKHINYKHLNTDEEIIPASIPKWLIDYFRFYVLLKNFSLINGRGDLSPHGLTDVPIRDIFMVRFRSLGLQLTPQ